MKIFLVVIAVWAMANRVVQRFKDGYEKGKRVGHILNLKRISKQIGNELVQAERSFEMKYGEQA